MTLLIPNEGEGRILNNFVNKVAPQDLDLFLFKSNTTPAETDTFATYTEADFTGYTIKNLAASDWTITEGAPSDATAAQQTFSSSADQSSQSIYGFGLKQHTSGKLMWAERFSDGPYSIANNGDQVKVTAKITLD